MSDKCKTCGGCGKYWPDSIVPKDCPDCNPPKPSPKIDTSEPCVDAVDPPEGYDGWLDYMVEEMDLYYEWRTRAETGKPTPRIDVMRAAELAGLRVRPRMIYKGKGEPAPFDLGDDDD